MDLIEASPDDLTDSLAFALLRQRKALQRFAQRAGHEPGMEDCQAIAKALVEHLSARGGEDYAAAIHVPQVPVIDDPDIFRAAKLMIDQHGDEAPIRAARRVDDLQAAGNENGSAIWLHVFHAICELPRTRAE